jgi:lipoprotein-releasing system permease protein
MSRASALGPAAFFARRILGLRRPAFGASHAFGASSAHEGADDAPGRRYLRGAVFGVALSLVPLVVVLVVADGMIEGITARYIEAGTYHLQAQSFVSPDPEAMSEAVRALRASGAVKAAFAERQSYGVALFGSRTAGLALRAVEPDFLSDPGTAAYLKASSGEARLEKSNEILLGEALAKDLGAKVGDAVSVVTTRSSSFAGDSSLVPKVSVFRVRGIVSAGYRQLDALWAFIPLKAGDRLFAAGNSRSIVGIKVADPYGDLERERTAVQSALSIDWGVLTWPEVERNVFKSFSTTRALLLLVMALAVAVAAINVSSALVMLVLERRRDIAILKSAGASPGFIGRVFLLAGLGIGGLGTILGIAAGSLVAWRINDLISLIEKAANLFARLGSALSGAASPPAAIKLLDPAYYIESIPVHLRPGELALVAAACLLLCLAASLVPARRASRLPPMEIFRKT